VIKNSNKTNLDYLSGFINSWELLQYIVPRFMIPRDPLRPFVITPFFLNKWQDYRLLKRAASLSNLKIAICKCSIARATFYRHFY